MDNRSVAVQADYDRSVGHRVKEEWRKGTRSSHGGYLTLQAQRHLVRDPTSEERQK